MEVGVFTILSTLTGGHLRILYATSNYPRKPTFLIPKNYYKVLVNTLHKYLNGSFLDFVENNTILLPSMDIAKFYAYPKYFYDIFGRVKDMFRNFDIVYIPHEHVGMMMLVRGIGATWTALLQLTPVIGSIPVEYPRNPLALISTNVKVNGMGFMGNKFFEYLIAKAVLHDAKLLAVSRSIPYEMGKIGLRADVKVLDPGVGVDSMYGRCDDRDIDVLFMGRLRPEKGIYDVVRVVKILKSMLGLRPKTVIAGAVDDRRYLNALKALVNKLRLNDLVSVMPDLGRGELMELASRAKVMVYPTRLDSVGLVILESLAHCTPVVAYNIPAVRMNFKTGAVLKVPVGDLYSMALAAAKILLDDEYRVKLGKEGLSFVRRYNWLNVALTEWEALAKVASQAEGGELRREATAKGQLSMALAL